MSAAPSKSGTQRSSLSVAPSKTARSERSKSAPSVSGAYLSISGQPSRTGTKSATGYAAKSGLTDRSMSRSGYSQSGYTKTGASKSGYTGTYAPKSGYTATGASKSGYTQTGAASKSGYTKTGKGYRSVAPSSARNSEFKTWGPSVSGMSAVPSRSGNTSKWGASSMRSGMTSMNGGMTNQWAPASRAGSVMPSESMYGQEPSMIMVNMAPEGEQEEEKDNTCCTIFVILMVLLFVLGGGFLIWWFAIRTPPTVTGTDKPGDNIPAGGGGGDQPAVVHPPTGDFCWQYQEDGEWWNYGTHSAKNIESAYQRHFTSKTPQSARIVVRPGYAYEVEITTTDGTAKQHSLEYTDGGPSDNRALGGKVRNARRHSSSPNQGQYMKLWQYQDGDWKYYKAQPNAEINRQLKAGNKVFNMDQNGRLYTTVTNSDHAGNTMIFNMNLNSMKQISLGPNKRERTIRHVRGN